MSGDRPGWDDAVAAAYVALHAIPGSSYTYPDSVARTVVAAAYPVIVAAVRADEARRIAEGIDAELATRRARVGRAAGDAGVVLGLQIAARLVREGGAG